MSGLCGVIEGLDFECVRGPRVSESAMVPVQQKDKYHNV